MTDVRTVYVTADDDDQAAELAAALLARGLIACANLLPPMRSLYLWEGEVQDEPEVAMLLKTRADRLDELVAAVEELHPYEVPCVVAWPIDAGSEAYLGWVRDVCRS
jgi:periplasmic divalent cation tolerance protein